MPQPEGHKKYDYTLAATKAFFAVVHKVVFSIDSLKQYEENIYNQFKELLDEEVYNRSVAFGEAVGNRILERVADDNYKKTRGMRKYLGSRDDGKWQPTSPDYLDGVEPFWYMIKPFVLDSAAQCKIPSPPVFSKDTNSAFYKNTLEVYNIGNNLTDSQKSIIEYWDDNPFVMEHSGHMMFANKKITPGGHWMGIATIASKQTKASATKTAQVYALTAIALADAFISCWEQKYKTEVVRPITVIHNLIDERWAPFLQTPPFPEYPSGHSAISASAATVLTHLFGENFSFHDDSDKEYIGMERDFSSFFQAAEEAAISRVYGGIHYRSGMEGGAVQGKAVGKLIIEKLRLKE
jgi:membrane-associated phospholipid phosphatase